MKEEELIADINDALKDYDTAAFTGRVHAKKTIVGTANIHAKQEAIAFAEWKVINRVFSVDKGDMLWWIGAEKVTTSQLYDIFKNQK